MKVRVTGRRIVGLAAGLALAGVAVGGHYLFYDGAIGQEVAVRNAALWITLGFGLASGIPSFFAPCSLALFPGYMSYYATSERTSSATRGASRYALVASVGIALGYTLHRDGAGPAR